LIKSSRLELDSIIISSIAFLESYERPFSFNSFYFVF
jgi:hypothetical protein